MYWIVGYLSYIFRYIRNALKIIKAGVYSDFRRTADASIHPPCWINGRTNIIIFSCHILVFFIYLFFIIYLLLYYHYILYCILLFFISSCIYSIVYPFGFLHLSPPLPSMLPLLFPHTSNFPNIFLFHIFESCNFIDNFPFYCSILPYHSFHTFNFSNSHFPSHSLSHTNIFSPLSSHSILHSTLIYNFPKLS